MTPCPSRAVADDDGGGGGGTEVVSIGGADGGGTGDKARPDALLGEDTLVEGPAPGIVVTWSLDNFCRLGEGAAMEGDGERVRPRVDMIGKAGGVARRDATRGQEGAAPG